MARTSTNARRARGHIRRRGGSFQVLVYAGVDPLTGKDNYLTESTRDEAQAQKILTRLLAQVDEHRNPRTKATLGAALEAWLRTHEAEATTLDGYRGYIRRTIEPALGAVPLAKITAQVLEEFYADLRRCRHRCRDGRPVVDHRTAGEHDCRSVRHKRRPGRPGRDVHDCAAAGCVVVECPPHTCAPMAASSIRQVHWIISAALAAAVRWEWIRANPADSAKKPKQRAPQPEPPSAADAARIIAAAWEQDDEWGTLVWLVMVTGMRRGEVLALRWSDIDLAAGMLAIRRNYVRSRARGIEKDTKTHQMRRISLDPDTVAVLADHRARYEEQVRLAGVEPSDQAFVFSYQPLRDAPADPSAVTHRYGRMCAGLRIDSHLHALRHYSATELLTAGVDLRTVAGRLGHGGGGATTLRVYAAWVGLSDRRAAELLGNRMKRADDRNGRLHEDRHHRAPVARHRREGHGSARRLLDGVPRPSRTAAVATPERVSSEALSYRDDRITLWDGGTGSPRGSVVDMSGHVTGVAFSPDGSHLAALLGHVTVDKFTYGPGAELGRPGTPIQTGGEARVWSIDSGLASFRYIAGLQAGPARPQWTDPIDTLSFSSDGSIIVTTNHFNEDVNLWDASTLTQLGSVTPRINAGANVVGAVALPEQKALVMIYNPKSPVANTSDASLQIETWDWKTGSVLRTISTEAFETSVYDDERDTLVALGAFSGNLAKWHLGSSQPSIRAAGPGGLTDSLHYSLSEDGRKVAFSRLKPGSTDFEVVIWDTDPDSIIAKICQRRPALSRDEWNTYVGADYPYDPFCE